MVAESYSIEVKSRLETLLAWYLFFLVVSARKHSLQEAAKFSGINKSQFSRFLKEHAGLAVYNLDQLSKRQAKQFSKAMKYLDKNTLPWKIAIIADSTIQKRSTLHTGNAQRFNHGKGFVIGHQWINIILLINDMIIPLPPISFHSKKYCRENRLEYKTEYESVVEYITNLNLEDYIGNYNPKDPNTPKSRGWSHVGELLRNHRRVKWQTVRIFADSSKGKRMGFRI